MTSGQRPDPSKRELEVLRLLADGLTNADERRWTQITVAFKRELYETIAALRLELALARAEIRELKAKLAAR